MPGPPRYLMKIGMVCGVLGALFGTHPFSVIGAAAAGFLFARLIATRDRPARRVR